MLSTTTPQISPRARLLFVDDDPWLRKMVSGLLTNRDVEIRTASNGHEALKEIDAATPDLVITDIDMPEMDGWTLVRTLRSRPQTALTPVLLLTMLKGAEDRIRGFRLGADDYIEKPFRFEELDLRINKALRASRSTKQALQGPATPTAPVVTAVRAKGMAGSLEEVGPGTLLVIFEGEKKTGVLRMRNGRSGARFTFSQGKLLRIDGEFELTGQDDLACIEHVLDWSTGSFEWQPGLQGEVENRLKRSVNELLLQTAMRHDQKKRA